jgi:hypothetical protein
VSIYQYQQVELSYNWILGQVLSPPVSGTEFGASVGLRISGQMDLVLVGVPDAASAYVYFIHGASWTQQQELTGPAGSSFGCSIALQNETVLIGATDTGEVYVYNAHRSTDAPTAAPSTATPTTTSTHHPTVIPTTKPTCRCGTNCHQIRSHSGTWTSPSRWSTISW